MTDDAVGQRLTVRRQAFVRALLEYQRGISDSSRLSRFPAAEEEDGRRLCGERKVLTAERIKYVNPIKGLLVSQ